jgi:hypothetical protein
MCAPDVERLTGGGADTDRSVGIARSVVDGAGSKVYRGRMPCAYKSV